MRKPLQTALCVLLCGALALGLSSCGVLKNIRESTQQAALRQIIETPAEESLIAYYNTALETALQQAETVREYTSFSADRPHAQGDESSVKIFDAAADTLKSMIMQFSPGTAERTLENGAQGSLLVPLETAEALGAAASRNQRTESVTDEKGKEVTDEDGNAVTQNVITDNLLTTDIRYYAEETVTETAQDGTVSEKTELRPANAVVIEKVFGAPREKETVLEAFAPVKDYLQVRDYTIEYRDCSVHAQADLNTNRLSAVSFIRNMAVTAAVTGVGQFSGLGDFTVTFNLRETVDYDFAYAED